MYLITVDILRLCWNYTSTRNRVTLQAKKKKKKSSNLAIVLFCHVFLKRFALCQRTCNLNFKAYTFVRLFFLRMFLSFPPSIGPWFDFWKFRVDNWIQIQIAAFSLWPFCCYGQKQAHLINSLLLAVLFPLISMYLLLTMLNEFTFYIPFRKRKKWEARNRQ